MPATTATTMKHSNKDNNHAISTANTIVAEIIKPPLHSALATKDHQPTT